MRGSLRQRSKGSWQIRYERLTDQPGRRKYLSETVRGTRRDAERVLRERLASLESGTYIPKHQETVAEFLERWLQTYVTTNTMPATQYGYRNKIQRYLLPTIGAIRLQRLTSRHIETIYSGMIKEQGLSPTTVLQTHRILKEALSHAVRWELLLKNPADPVIPPRVNRRTLEIWARDEIRRFFETSNASPYRDFFHLAVLTGMRRSEVVGLQWQSVDLSAGAIRVVQTLHYIPKQGFVKSDPKTPKARRLINLGAEGINLLHSIRGAQLESRLAAGDLWRETGYVFTNELGGPLLPEAVSRNFALLVRNAKLPPMRLHDLRHTFATLLLAGDVNLKVVAELLGHSTITTTADIYSHVLPPIRRDAADVIEKQLRVD